MHVFIGEALGLMQQLHAGISLGTKPLLFSYYRK